MLAHSGPCKRLRLSYRPTRRHKGLFASRGDHLVKKSPLRSLLAQALLTDRKGISTPGNGHNAYWQVRKETTNRLTRPSVKPTVAVAEMRGSHMRVVQPPRKAAPGGD